MSSKRWSRLSMRGWLLSWHWLSYCSGTLTPISRFVLIVWWNSLIGSILRLPFQLSSWCLTFNSRLDCLTHFLKTSLLGLEFNFKFRNILLSINCSLKKLHSTEELVNSFTEFWLLSDKIVSILSILRICPWAYCWISSKSIWAHNFVSEWACASSSFGLSLTQSSTFVSLSFHLIPIVVDSKVLNL